MLFPPFPCWPPLAPAPRRSAFFCGRHPAGSRAAGESGRRNRNQCALVHPPTARCTCRRPLSSAQCPARQGTDRFFQKVRVHLNVFLCQLVIIDGDSLFRALNIDTGHFIHTTPSFHVPVTFLRASGLFSYTIIVPKKKRDFYYPFWSLKWVTPAEFRGHFPIAAYIVSVLSEFLPSTFSSLRRCDF